MLAVFEQDGPDRRVFCFRGGSLRNKQIRCASPGQKHSLSCNLHLEFCAAMLSVLVRQFQVKHAAYRPQGTAYAMAAEGLLNFGKSLLRRSRSDREKHV